MMADLTVVINQEAERPDLEVDVNPKNLASNDWGPSARGIVAPKGLLPINEILQPSPISWELHNLLDSTTS